MEQEEERGDPAAPSEGDMSRKKTEDTEHEAELEVRRLAHLLRAAEARRDATNLEGRRGSSQSRRAAQDERKDLDQGKAKRSTAHGVDVEQHDRCAGDVSVVQAQGEAEKWSHSCGQDRKTGRSVDCNEMA